MATIQANKILRLPEVMQTIGLSRSSIYNRIDSNSDYFDASFPKPIRLSSTGKGCIGWLECEIQDWLKSRFEASSENKAPLAKNER